MCCTQYEATTSPPNVALCLTLLNDVNRPVIVSHCGGANETASEGQIYESIPNTRVCVHSLSLVARLRPRDKLQVLSRAGEISRSVCGDRWVWERAWRSAGICPTLGPWNTQAGEP